MTLDPTLHPPVMAFLTPWTHRTLPRAYGYAHVCTRATELLRRSFREREKGDTYQVTLIASNSSESATDYSTTIVSRPMSCQPNLPEPSEKLMYSAVRYRAVYHHVKGNVKGN